MSERRLGYVLVGDGYSEQGGYIDGWFLKQPHGPHLLEIKVPFQIIWELLRRSPSY